MPDLIQQTFPELTRERINSRVTIVVVATSAVGLILSLAALFLAIFTGRDVQNIIQYLITAVTTSAGTLAGFVGGRGAASGRWFTCSPECLEEVFLG